MCDATPPRRRRNLYGTMALFGTVMLVGGTDMTKVTVALPSLTHALDLTPAQTLWIADLYALAAGAVLVLGAVAADRYGRKRVYVLGLVVAIAGAALAGLATTGALMIAARVGQGVGSALLIAGTVAIIRVSFSEPRSRVLAYGVWTAGFSTGSALGPLVGGGLVDLAGWPWVFWINVPVLLVCLVWAGVVLRESTNPDPPMLDLFSVVLSAVAVLLLVSGLKSLVLPTAALWFTPMAMTAGTAAAVLFALRQLRMFRPFLDVRLLADGLLTNAAVVIAVTLGVFHGTLYLLTLRYQVVGGLSAVAAGIALMPLAVAMACGGLIGPVMSRRLTRQHVLIGGLLLAALGFLLLATVAGDGRPVGMIVLGLGAGVVMAIGADTVMSSAPENRTADAGALQESAFALGAGTGIAALGTMALHYAVPTSGERSAAAIHGAGTDTALGIAALLYAFFALAAGTHLLGVVSRGRRVGGRGPRTPATGGGR
ncbi:MFS transporter [Nocardiopsis sp. MG754419]|uniref:MFS transporter n=1 Tax=Nocardiopsis sp. MG754419 TaxID=2259865 RepID=UPI001BA5029B|nr:MFS transporter [Nocardiopsis sp. MG754419]MBR8743828.1 MFS transporter [Nocardiopsis sp. MG754419]